MMLKKELMCLRLFCFRRRFCSQSSFLVKRESGRIQFSMEKYNLTAKNSFKYQGIANGKAVDIAQYYAETDKEKKSPKGNTLTTKSKKGINAPVSTPPLQPCALAYAYLEFLHSVMYSWTPTASW